MLVKRNKGILMMLFLMFVLNSVGAQVVRSGSGLLQENSDDDYYYALIEATKQYLLQNYREAVSLYIECLKYNQESAAVNFQLSQIFRKAGDMQRAEEYGIQAYRNDGTNRWYMINLINLYQVNAKEDSALVMMERLAERVPYDMEYKYMLAGLYEQAGDFQKALECLDEVEKQLGISKEVLIAKYGLLRQYGRDKEALGVLRIAKEYFNDDYAIDGMIAEFYRDQHALDSAQHYYEKIIPEHIAQVDVAVSYSEFLAESGKSDSSMHVMMAMISSEEVDLREKESYFYQLLQDEVQFGKVSFMMDTLTTLLLFKYPDEIGVKSIFADVQMRLGDYEQASSMLKQIFNYDRSNYIALEQLIYLENLMDRQDSIIYYAKVAVDVFRSRPVPYLYLGSSLLQQLNYKEAIRYMEQGRRYVSGETLQVQYYGLMAENYYGLNMFDSAWSCFDVALAIEEENMIINNNYAYYLAEQETMLQKAESMSFLTIKNDPTNPTYLDTYAWVMFKMGALKQARKYIKKALKYNGYGDAEILDHFGDILFTLGKYKDSIEIWNKAVGFDASKREIINSKISDAEQKIK